MSERLEISAPLLAEAQERCTALLQAERNVSESLQALCEATWHFGRCVAALKSSVSHGHWMFYLANHFPQLGEAEPTRVRRANDARAFFEANPNWPVPATFSEESIRKIIFRQAPEKTRPELPGNKPVPPAVHHLGFVNSFMQWDRRVSQGLATAPEREVLRRELEPVVRRLAALTDPEWIRQIIATP